ncbi:NADPH-dependent FMN reductase [Plantibacter sp. ME-Dv--P-122b]|uniref:NADPH-dependent FMN reductase n=1 Tax=Plantibacter sp. ME-Dv--P-122b TaxID=3040300 RepID=UPI00254B7EED|nr:NADPH-dependent FMN reductase [Plantibacter sp. ME-Dv--P-122b]
MAALNLPVISCSLDPASRSRTLASASGELLREQGHDSSVIDLAEMELPAFDNDRVFASPAFRRLHELITAADGVVLAFPVYNWAPAASVKSLIEATGATGEDGRVAAWFDKVVTFVCAAGLPHSYMATAALGQSLMLDFKCVINPYTAYLSERDWEAAGLLKTDRAERLAKTMTVHAELSALLAERSYRSVWEV